MEDTLMKIMIVIGAVVIMIPSYQLKSRKKVGQMPRGTFWRLVLMYLLGAGLIAGGFVIGGV